MSKVILLRNTTPFEIALPEIGETVPVAVGSPVSGLDMTNTPANIFRRSDILETVVASGDIVISDGVLDMSPSIGYEYLVNDTVADEDGFWYGARRRFSIIWQQPNHGFVVGNIVKLDEVTGQAALALADSHKNSATTAFVSEIIDENSFYAGLTGSTISGIQQAAVVEPLPLTQGAAYFLSPDVLGKMTTVPPTDAGDVVKLLGVAIGIDTIIGFAYPGYINETAVQGAEAQAMMAGSGFSRTVNTWQRAVKSAKVIDPSTLSPSKGDRYLIPEGAVGEWQGLDNSIVEYRALSDTWYVVEGKVGFVLLVEDVGSMLIYGAVGWIGITGVTVAENEGGSTTLIDSITTLNFSDMDVSTDPINPLTATVKNIFGSQFYKVEDDSITTTDTDVEIEKLHIDIPSMPIGNYRIEVSYGWNYADTKNEFEAWLEEDDTVKGQRHHQRPTSKDGNFENTGSSQRYYHNRVYYSTYTKDEAHFFSLKFRSTEAGTKASMWDASITFYRVS